MKNLEATVYPSKKQDIYVLDEKDKYGGAHLYIVDNSGGFENGAPVPAKGTQSIQFCHKDENGRVTPGMLNEHLYIILLDRLRKLNNLFPCEENVMQIRALEICIDACKTRVDDRIARGVMGKLKL